MRRSCVCIFVPCLRLLFEKGAETLSAVTPEISVPAHLLQVKLLHAVLADDEYFGFPVSVVKPRDVRNRYLKVCMVVDLLPLDSKNVRLAREQANVETSNDQNSILGCRWL